MKRMILAVLATALLSLPLAAQPQKAKPAPKAKPTPELLAQRQSRQIVATLGVSGETAETFCQMYTNYKKEMHGLKDQFPMARKQKVDGVEKELTDTEIEQNILARFAMAKATVEVREKYYQEFRKILTPGQIQAVYNLEKKNAAKFVQNAQNRKPKPGPGANRGKGPKNVK